MSSSVDDEVPSVSSSASLIHSTLPGVVNTFQQAVSIDDDDEEEEEEDLVDPAEVIKAKCESASCQKYRDRYDECNARVASKKATEETCVEEVMDLFHCVDHCAAPKISATFK